MRRTQNKKTVVWKNFLDGKLMSTLTEDFCFYGFMYLLLIDNQGRTSLR